MTEPVKKLIEDCYALSEEDRAIVRVELDDDTTDSPEDVEAAWRDELQRRVDEIERNEVELLDGEQTFAKLRAKFDRT
jgi:hypothetical protein